MQNLTDILATTGSAGAIIASCMVIWFLFALKRRQIRIPSLLTDHMHADHQNPVLVCLVLWRSTDPQDVSTLQI